MGFAILATKGTCDFLNDHGVSAQFIYKVNEGRPNVLDALKNNDIQMVINTPSNGVSCFDDKIIRQESYKLNVPVITTLAGAKQPLKHMRNSNKVYLCVLCKIIYTYHNSFIRH